MKLSKHYNDNINRILNELGELYNNDNNKKYIKSLLDYVNALRNDNKNLKYQLVTIKETNKKLKTANDKLEQIIKFKNDKINKLNEQLINIIKTNNTQEQYIIAEEQDVSLNLINKYNMSNRLKNIICREIRRQNNKYACDIQSKDIIDFIVNNSTISNLRGAGDKISEEFSAIRTELLNNLNMQYKIR